MRTFVIVNGKTEHKVAGRRAAVDRAKQMSDRTWRPIRVASHDNRVSMLFRNGKLQKYHFETRR